ncbi:MAG: TrkA family potassium uptake protein [Thermodesulfobacteriota bacterium]
MSRFAVIGLSNFGASIAKALFERGHEVIVLDRNDNLVKTAQPYCSYGLVGEATDQTLLNSLQVETLDAVFVCMGDSMADSILTTLLLRDFKARKIVAKIISEEHGRILLKVGAHEVVFPERDMAMRVATYVSSPTIMDYLDLSPEYAVQEVAPPQRFVGKTLAETGIRRDFGVNVIGIKDVLRDSINLNPEAQYTIKDSDVLIVIGRRENLSRLTQSK